MDNEIDVLLAKFARELDYFVFTRDHLQPVMETLLASIETYLRSRESIAFEAARDQRKEYVLRMEGLAPLIDEWVAIRGSGERLWEAEHAMTAAQFERFQSLLDREAGVIVGRGQFDKLQDTLRRRLLLLEELTG